MKELTECAGCGPSYVVPTEGKHQPRRGVQWGLVGACIAAAAIAFHARGEPPRAGDRIRAAFTVVPKDQYTCQCALPQDGDHRCRYAFGPDGVVRANRGHENLNWAPYWTTDRNLYVVDGLFDVPEVRRAARDRSLLPSAEQRFIARCTVELVANVSVGKARFPGETGWSPLPPTWFVRPRACSVD